jgi:hypothetical protein
MWGSNQIPSSPAETYLCMATLDGEGKRKKKKKEAEEENVHPRAMMGEEVHLRVMMMVME